MSDLANAPTGELANSSTINDAESIYLPDKKLNVPILLKHGEVLFNAHEFSLAKNIYRLLVASGEVTGLGLFHLGKCAEAEGDVEEAISKYEESATYQPSLDTYRKLAALCLKQSNDRKAAEIFERAILLKDLTKTVLFELHQACGNCWSRVKEIQRAETHFRKCLDINPSADEIRSNLGTIYLQANQLDTAKRNFRDAIASNPENSLALAGLGMCFYLENDKKSAHDTFVRSLELNIRNSAALFHLIKCAYEIRSYAVATKILTEYVEIAPVQPDLLYCLAGLQFQLGKMKEARATAQKVIQIRPEHAAVLELIKKIERYHGN